ncbi:MAG TPA: SDR family NAD(P)-dependent oxidoreductase [Streptosporangiaceae bacterium]
MAGAPSSPGHREQTFAVNVTATWQLSRAVLPGMIERGFGRILYVSSVAAFTGGVVGPHYAASRVITVDGGISPA